MERRLALLVVGNEILTGKVEDQNTPYLARRIWELGSRLERVVVVPDEIGAIAHELNTLRHVFDVVITSGGIGPTHDDVTMEAIAYAFGIPLVQEPGLFPLLGAQHLEGKMRMAYIPNGASLIQADDGTFPIVRMENVYILPGVPRLFQKKLELIASQFSADPYFIESATFSVPESWLSQTLASIQRAHPDLQIGSYPKIESNPFVVLVTIEGKDASRVQAALRRLQSSFPPEYFAT
jgi:molybdenum cofactor synthesis domain-containing protein